MAEKNKLWQMGVRLKKPHAVKSIEKPQKILLVGDEHSTKNAEIYK